MSAMLELDELEPILGGVTNGKIRALPRRRDPSLKIRARALNLFVKSEPES